VTGAMKASSRARRSQVSAEGLKICGIRPLPEVATRRPARPAPEESHGEIAQVADDHVLPVVDAHQRVAAELGQAQRVSPGRGFGPRSREEEDRLEPAGVTLWRAGRRRSRASGGPGASDRGVVRSPDHLGPGTTVAAVAAGSRARVSMDDGDR
jgi:hypothetical protein